MLYVNYISKKKIFSHINRTVPHIRPLPCQQHTHTSSSLHNHLSLSPQLISRDRCSLVCGLEGGQHFCCSRTPWGESGQSEPLSRAEREAWPSLALRWHRDSHSWASDCIPPSPAPRHHKAHPLGSPTLTSAHRGRLHGPAVRSALQGPCKLQGHRLWALHLLMCPIWIPVLGPVFSFILEGHTESTPKQRGPLAGRGG